MFFIYTQPFSLPTIEAVSVPNSLMFLETLPAPIVSAAMLPYMFSVLSLLLTLFALFRKESREDGQTSPQRLRKLEVELANQSARQQGFQAEIEDVADYAELERKAMSEAHNRDYDALKDLIKDVPDMRNLLARMDERFQSTKEEIKSLKDDVKSVATKADRIVELLTPAK